MQQHKGTLTFGILLYNKIVCVHTYVCVSNISRWHNILDIIFYPKMSKMIINILKPSYFQLPLDIIMDLINQNYNIQSLKTSEKY